MCAHQRSLHSSCHHNNMFGMFRPSKMRRCVGLVNSGRRRVVVTTATAAAEKRFAVVGAGLAGLATAYHLLKLSRPGAPVHVTVVDAVGIGAGGSGAAAGLLHPFSPKGKLLWKAEEAMAAAVQLLAAAEEAAEAPDVVAWRTGMLRPASSAKQSQDYWKLHRQQQQQSELTLHAAVVNVTTANQLVPGVKLPAMTPAAAAVQDQQQQQRRHVKQQRQQQPQLDGWSAAEAAALHIPGGITLHPLRYMHSLWKACELVAASRQDGSSAQLHIQQLSCLAELQSFCRCGNGSGSSSAAQQQQQSQRQFDAIVVAAGAAVGSLSEFTGQLPISLCQGYTLDMVPAADSSSSSSSSSSDDDGSSSSSSGDGSSSSSSSGYSASAPSLLGSPYVASQGGQVLVVGATKDFSYTTEQALTELGRQINTAILQQQHCAGAATEAESALLTAADELLAGAAAVWPAVASRDWKIGAVRTGVRALPPRTQYGSIPIVGKWRDKEQQGNNRPPVWLLVGLGARGLVYHAWLGQLTAQAVVHDSEEHMPQELLAWKNAESSALQGGRIAAAAAATEGSQDAQ